MKQLSVRVIVQAACLFLVSLFVLLSLSFVLQSRGPYYSECGFDLLDGQSIFITSSFQWGATTMQIVNILILIAGIAGIFLSVYYLFAKNRGLLGIAIVAGAIFLGMLYMIEGIVFTALNKASYGDDGFSTVSYLPLILIALFSAGYFVTGKILAPPQEQPTEESNFYVQEAEYAAESRQQGGETMSEERAREVMSVIKDYLPQGRYAEIKNRLLRSGDAAADAVLSAKLYETLSIVLRSVFFGVLGVDRFTIGDTGLGAGKLLLGWLTLGLWPLIDILFCYKKAQEKNYQTIVRLLR